MKKKKVRLIKCSKCNNRAIYFPFSKGGLLARKKYCRTHWNHFQEYYVKVIESPSGVIVGVMDQLITRLEDDETLDVWYKDSTGAWVNHVLDEFNKIAVGITAGHKPQVHFTYDSRHKKLTLWERIVRAIKNLFR